MAEAQVYARFPSIAGSRLIFVADDDLWTVTTDGGSAWRLTADCVRVRDPHLSADGSVVAYVSRREGPPEVYVVGPEPGDEPRRVTYWGDAGVRVLGWTPEGRIVATTTVTEPFRSRTWAWALPVDGSPPERLPYGPVTALGFHSAGAVVVGVDQSPARGAAWKRYRGGTAAKVWIDRSGDGEFARFLGHLDGQIEDPGFCADRIVCVSDHEGYGNVYSASPDGTDLRRHTDHADFYARAADTDGSRVVYQCAGDLWILDDLTARSQARPVDIRLASTRVGRRSSPLPAADKLGTVATDHDGTASAVEVEGNLVWLTHRDGPAPLLSSGSAVRARLPGVLASGSAARVVWVTDAEGEDGLEVATSVTGGDGPGARRRLAVGELGRVLELRPSPDGRLVAVASHDGALHLVAMDTGRRIEVDRSRFGAAGGLAWSPDSAWLAWSHAGPAGGENLLHQIRMVRVEWPQVGEIIEATPLRFDDHDPVFTLDGRYLAFLSARTFDPVYDEQVFDVSFQAVTRPYLLALATSTVSPFQPLTAGRSRSAAPPSPAASDDGPCSVTVDVDGLAGRVVTVPVAAGRYRHLQAVDGGLVWEAPPLAGELGEDRSGPTAEPSRPTLVRYDLAERREVTLLDALDRAHVTGDGRAIVVRDKSSLRVVPSAKPASSDSTDVVDVDLTRVRLQVDPPARWLQMFDETVRLMRDHYWVEDMAGVDWAAVAARYRPLVARLGTRNDLSELLWELHGELGSSHAYEMPPEQKVDDAMRQGRLGADLAPGGAGGWVVEAVVASETSVPAASSPLAAPGARVGPGDRIVAIDGRPVDPVRGPGPLLVGAPDRPVEVTIEPGGGGDRRSVVIVPVADELPLRYQAWVADRRAAVHAATGDRVGYLHVPDMQALGWAQLHRDLRVEMAREALVVDFRDNGGGHLSQLVLEKLSRVITGWATVRHQAPTSYPEDAPRGPMVAIANQFAGSDGDIGTNGFKRRRLGQVVGTRTWGGVIGIDGAYKLVDGTTVTQPRYSFWFDEAGWGVENYGVDPDVEVPIAPQDWAAGRDPQLDTAIRIVLEALAHQPALTPPDPSTRPSRRPPPLAPRPS